MNTRQLIITNRALPLDYAAGELPRRIHIVPRGELYNKAAGVTQVLDDKAIDSILADLQDVKAKNGGLYLGEEHFIYNSDRSSQAFCWGKKFEKDERGIWAVEPEFTDVGTPAIQNRRFKWTSFVADAETPGAVEKLGNGKVRILKIDTVGFTNYANGKSLLTPITNRDPNNLPGSREPGANQQTNQRTNTMKSIATKLGLAPEASEDAILGEVTNLQNRVKTLEPFEAENTTLKNRVAEIETAQVETEVSALLAERKVTDTKLVNRIKPVLAKLKNREERIAFLDDCGFKADAAKPAAQQRILNRNDGNNGATGTDAAAQQAFVETIRIKNRCSFRDAWDQAKREKPELFAVTN